MLTDTVVKKSKACYKKSSLCIGDSGNIECFFCPGCVLSLGELIGNLKGFHHEIAQAKPQEAPRMKCPYNCSNQDIECEHCYNWSHYK